MRSNNKKYFVFMGNFGSGKTELALHFARASAKAGNPTSLVDLDVVNPYFRAAERRQELAQEGVRLITQNFATSNVEIITITPEVYSVFVPGEGSVIFDVGGDAVGSRAIGQYKPYFDRIPPEDLRVWLVVNSHRPLSSTPERVERILDEISASSRLSVNGLINNGNMSYESNGHYLAESYHVLRKVSIDTGIPVIMTTGEEKPLAEFRDIAAAEGFEQKYIGEIVTISTLMHRDWERFVRLGF